MIDEGEIVSSYKSLVGIPSFNPPKRKALSIKNSLYESKTKEVRFSMDRCWSISPKLVGSRVWIRRKHCRKMKNMIFIIYL